MLDIEYWLYIGMTLLVPIWPQLTVGVWMTMKYNNNNQTMATRSKYKAHWTAVTGNIMNDTWEQKQLFGVMETTIKQHKHGITTLCCTWHIHENGACPWLEYNRTLEGMWQAQRRYWRMPCQDEEVITATDEWRHLLRTEYLKDKWLWFVWSFQPGHHCKILQE